jgi:molybdopterin molybdotransferase
MISVAEAVARIAAAFTPVEAETVSVAEACGRVLAQDAVARLTLPPAPVSSMDGYAVRAADAATVPVTLDVIGTSPAGHPFAGTLNSGQAVRIFTGGVVPEGADAIVIQEDTEARGDRVVIKQPAQFNRHIRTAGLDFKTGDVLVAAGRRLSARDVALIAGGDVADVAVRRKPRVAFVATGDELSPPGQAHPPGGIVASSGYGLSAMIAQWGGAPRDLGILPDRMEAIAQIPALAAGADLIVTLGGASVGEHDLIQKALQPHGFVLDFWKIAMRPGKPLIFGRLKGTPLIGLPGNPVSSFVCAFLFVAPAIAALLGTKAETMPVFARLAHGLPANGPRQDYIRARTFIRERALWVEPFAIQDSSMLSILAHSTALILRPPHAPPAPEGESVEILPLAGV